MVVLTGGPGSGKTSLVESLRDQGFRVAKESGRSVLQGKGGIALRSGSPEAYAMAMFELDEQNFQISRQSEKPTIFDRGLPDIAGYLELMGCQIPEKLHCACVRNRYSGPIFAAPPWQEIYINDNERTQSLDLACGTYEAVCSAWRRYDYRLIDLPKTSIENRTKFVLKNLN